MSRLKDAIMQNRAWSRGANAPMVDLKYGGQMGYAPNYAEWVSNAAYVQKNLIPLLVEYPRGFDYLPEPQEWINTLRALVELHVMSIEGLTATLDVETAENPAGGGGQMQEDFTNVTMARTQVQMRWNEKYGSPISQFYSQYIRMLMMDPDTKVAGLSTLGTNRPGDMLPDMYTFTMAFIEPDPHHNRVLRSWLVTNLFPHGSGEITGRRDITAPGETRSIDINMGGLAQYGFGVDVFCQELLSGIDITNANPLYRPSFVSQIDASILKSPRGYEAGAEQLGREAVTP